MAKRQEPTQAEKKCLKQAFDFLDLRMLHIQHAGVVIPDAVLLAHEQVLAWVKEVAK